MIDAITLEIMRAKLEAIADDGANAIVRTAISPLVTDAKDCSCALYTAEGALIVGGGHVETHFHTGTNGVRAIRETHGGTIVPGDLFLVNDPYSGGGFHAQDVFIHQPIFYNDELVAWVGTSAHMMDMGGGLPGSFVPDATECYQEAIRIPPVRLSRAGEEQSDVWAILLNNIRISHIVEMDMRALISGTNVVAEAIVELAKEYGNEQFQACTQELIDLSEKELRARIAKLEPGKYSAIRWLEWTDTEYRFPCTLTVTDGRLIFDFEGAAPQTFHYYNSKPYVIHSFMGVQVAGIMATDLPLNEGIFNCIELRCPKGSIVDAQEPAPIGAPHMEGGQTALEAAVHALTLAIAAGNENDARRLQAAPISTASGVLCTWAGIGHMGQPDGWVLLDGGAGTGPGAGNDRDGGDVGPYMLGKGPPTELPDTETMEESYPMQVTRRTLRENDHGAGEYRSGFSIDLSFQGVGNQTLYGALLGNRERIPVPGFAGGYPSTVNVMEIEATNGDTRPAMCHTQNVGLADGETLRMLISGGGGWGDPLCRDIAAVETDVKEQKLSAQSAQETYGVIVGDAEGTETLRATMLKERLQRAEPPVSSHEIKQVEVDWKPGTGRSLYPGVEVKDGLAVSTRSGAVLAASPNNWLDGCPVIHQFLPSEDGVDIAAYLDPLTGHTLAVDVIKVGDVERGFDSQPDFWMKKSA